MLLEQLAGVVAKPLMQIGQLALVGVIRAELEDARGLVIGKGGKSQSRSESARW